MFTEEQRKAVADWKSLTGNARFFRKSWMKIQGEFAEAMAEQFRQIEDCCNAIRVLSEIGEVWTVEVNVTRPEGEEGDSLT